MARPEDYLQLGIKPGLIEPREVGRRENAVPGSSELWHFEASMEDGTKTAVAFCLVGPGPSGDESFSTVVNVFVAMPDGRELQSTVPGSVDVSTVGTARCELPFGPHFAVGDLERYNIKVDPVEVGNSSGRCHENPVPAENPDPARLDRVRMSGMDDVNHPSQRIRRPANPRGRTDHPNRDPS